MTLLALGIFTSQKSKIELKGAQTGLHPDEAHHHSHLLQLQEYAASVAFCHDDKMRLDAVPEIPSPWREFLTLATQLDSAGVSMGEVR